MLGPVQYHSRTRSNYIAFLRIAVGIFFLGEAVAKLPWLSGPELLLARLHSFVPLASLNKWYLINVAIPHADLWSKAIFAGELAIGLSLVLGLLTRFSIPVAVLLVLNFLFTSNALFTFTFFYNPYAWLLLSCLIFLFITKAGSTNSLSESWSGEGFSLW